MKKQLIGICLALSVIWGFSSCEGCVKSTTKKITKLGMSAVEGVSEAVDEKGEELAEKTADAAGKLAVGVGRSLDRQLDEHAEKVFSVAGRTTVQVVDGFVGGFNEEVKEHYTEIPYTEDFVSGVSMDYFAKYKSLAVVDAYFIISEKGKYQSKFECYDDQDKLFLTKVIDIDRTTDVENRKYTLVSFALNGEEDTNFSRVKNVKITVTKQ